MLSGLTLLDFDLRCSAQTVAAKLQVCLNCHVLLQDLMLLKQSQVLTNLASLDEDEAGRAELASQRWQVSTCIIFSLTDIASHTLLSSAATCFGLYCAHYAESRLGSHHTVLMLEGCCQCSMPSGLIKLITCVCCCFDYMKSRICVCPMA